MNIPARIVSAALVLAVALPVAVAHAADDPGTDTVAPTTTAVSTPTVAVPVRQQQRTRVTIAYSRVVLDEQRAYFYNSNRRLIATLRVSTGVDEQTPLGMFTVYSKSETTFFTPKPSERMRYMTRFTVGRRGGNIGFHGIPYTVTKFGEVPMYTPLGLAPSSHGCIRMKEADARWVFENMPLGATVSVVRSRR
jgi:lipoprotein-anchoring transpeptidase ErfK/SrfK